jgi:ABC-type siderophore export system fused ATPase/permease subunit
MDRAPGNDWNGPDHGRAVVTHDTRLLEFADRILYIEDGALTHEEQRQRANVYRLRA